MKKRYIFDLDGTLLRGDWTTTDQYFLDTFGEDAKPFLDNMGDILAVYEKHYPRYDYSDLSEYLKETTQLDITPKDIQEWDHLVGEIDNIPEEQVYKILECLRMREDVSLAVLTNWFRESQIKRLKNTQLYEYFDAIYGGDMFTKPHKKAYFMAAADYLPEQCVFIGDNLDNDYIGPKACGMDAIIYDKDNCMHKSLKKIRRLGELKDK